MKKFLLSLTALISTAGLLSAQSNISFAVPDGYRLSVTLSNLNSSNAPSSQAYVRYDNISSGNYTATIRVWNNGGFFPQTSTQYLQVRDGFETNYFIISINNSLQMYKANEVAINRYNNGYDNNGWGNNGRNGRDRDRDRYGDGYGYGRNAMTNEDIAELKTYLRKQSFDDRKLKMLKRVVQDSWFYTRQVKDLMSAFSFDDKKLAFAKMAYDRTLDKYNYYKLSDAFSFGSSYDELEDYIAQK